MTMTQPIKLAEFSQFPFGRYDRVSPASGERFRRERLLPAFSSEGPVEVDLDGARGLSPSFLEEAFGGLVREGVPAQTILDRLVVRSARDPSLKALIEQYIREAGARAQ